MKRVMCCALAAVLVFCALPYCANAAEETGEIIPFENGSYMTVEIIQNGARATNTVTGSKVYTHYDSDGVSNWKATLTGTFTYTGSSATCTASSVSVTIYDTSWSTSSKYAYRSGNTATASVTMVQKVLGATVSTIPCTITLSCDANGNLS